MLVDREMSVCGTELPIPNVLFHGESWRISRPLADIAKMTVHDPERTSARSATASLVRAFLGPYNDEHQAADMPVKRASKLLFA
jgi:hypothetical protein